MEILILNDPDSDCWSDTMDTTRSLKQRKMVPLPSRCATEWESEFNSEWLLGDAAFAVEVLHNNGVKDVFAVVFCWGVGVMLGVSIAGGVSGGHLNPAVSFALGCVKKMPWKKVPVYILAQHLGGFVASAVLFATYIDGIHDLDGGTRKLIGENGTAYIWATYPREGISIATTFLNEVVATGILTMTAVAIIDKRNMKFSPGSEALFLGLMITTVAFCFCFNDMAPLNPARDFPTRLFTAIAGWGIETFSYRQYWWVGIVGPHVGGVIGVYIYYLCVELHLPDDEPEEENELKTRKENSGKYNQESVPRIAGKDLQLTLNSSDL